MNPQLPRLPILNVPAELIEAAKAHKRGLDAVAITAEKWGHVADALLSWESAALLLFGFLIGIMLRHALSRNA